MCSYTCVTRTHRSSSNMVLVIFFSAMLCPLRIFILVLGNFKEYHILSLQFPRGYPCRIDTFLVLSKDKVIQKICCFAVTRLGLFTVSKQVGFISLMADVNNMLLPGNHPHIPVGNLVSIIHGK